MSFRGVSDLALCIAVSHRRPWKKGAKALTVVSDEWRKVYLLSWKCRHTLMCASTSGMSAQWLRI